MASVVITALPDVTPAHVLPSVELAMRFVPAPTAIHLPCPHANALQYVVNIAAPAPVQAIPFVE